MAGSKAYTLTLDGQCYRECYDVFLDFGEDEIWQWLTWQIFFEFIQFVTDDNKFICIHVVYCKYILLI